MFFSNQVCNNDAVALDAWMHQFKMAAAASRVGTFIAELAGIGGKGEGEQGFVFKCCSISRVIFLRAPILFLMSHPYP